ncbi:hypothetical protein ACIQHU_01315 [Streptomyces tendae]|uniref:hypothetical protein n=1 Tax=Streptomyces tendae TaxID=1932 RepID=UPI00382BF24E
MSAPSTVAAALASLLDAAPSWLPQVDHWEIAEDTDTWILSGQLAGELSETAAFQLLAPVMERATSAHSDDGSLVKVPFEWDGVAGQVWYLRPVTRWVVPERCASCPTLLADAGNQFVRLGGGPGAPVICVPCRDRMHEAWVREAAVRELGALPMPVGPGPETDDRAKAPWGRGEDGRPLLPMGAHWTDIPEMVDRQVAKIQARVDQAKPGAWYRAPATELGVAPGTVRTHIDGYPRMVGQFTNVLHADLEMVLYAGSDLRWCLEMIAKFRARVAELEAAQDSVYRAEHPDSGITLGHYSTAKAARDHCEETERRSWPDGTTLAFDWIEDDEDRVAELVVTAGQNEESATGYLVTALELDSKYDAEAAE